MIDTKEDNENTIEENIDESEILEESINSLKEDSKLMEEKTIFDQEENENNQEKEEDIEIKLQEEIDQLRDEKLRLLADMENLRKRSEKEKIDSIRYGSINLARDILSPDDNLTRALEAIPQEEENSETINNLIDGLKMVQKEFATILEKYGVKKIEALDKKFDHNFHQAMVEIESDKTEPGMVIQEMQSGYIMHDRLLRPSMVGVSKKLEKKEKKEEN